MNHSFPKDLPLIFFIDLTILFITMLIIIKIIILLKLPLHHNNSNKKLCYNMEFQAFK
jgi:hypothetical protein